MNKILKNIKFQFFAFVLISTFVLLLTSTIDILESLAIDSLNQKFRILETSHFFSFVLLIIFIGISYFINLILNYFYYKIYNKFVIYTSKSVAKNFYEQYFIAKSKEINNYNSDFAFNHILNNSQNIFISSIVPFVGIISMSINFAFIFSYLSYQNWIIGIFTLFILIISSLSKIPFLKKIEFYILNTQNAFNNLVSQMSYYLDRFSILYYNNKQNLIIGKMEQDIYDYCTIAYKSEKINILSSEIPSIIIEIGKIIGIILLSFFILNKTFNLSIGIIYLFIKIISNFKDNFLDLISNIQSFIASKKLYNTLNLSLLKQERTEELNDINIISLNNLELYRGNKVISKKLSFEFIKGKKYVIIGKSGSGKTTLIKTLLKENEVFNGDITFNDTNIKKLNTREILKNISYLSPDLFIFNQNIVNNISLFSNDVLIEKQLEFVELKEEISEKIYLKNLDSDSVLSLGQKQRIALARTFSFDKNILILDESLSNLNKELRNKILDKLLKLDKTIIVISHHLEPQDFKKFDGVLNLDL